MMTRTHALLSSLLLGAALALAGCDQPEPDAQGLPDDRAKQENAQQRVLAGKVMYRERNGNVGRCIPDGCTGQNDR